MKIELCDTVKNAIDFIIDKENYKTSPEIDVTPGSQEGDGYSSKTYAITIKSNDGKDPLKLFVKYLPDVIHKQWVDMLRYAYKIENRFYNEIYPAFDKFQKSKNVKNPFDNIPKHFNVNLNNNEIAPIVLENLRSLGYTLRGRKMIIDDVHLRLPIEALARYHAISYAMKDQEPEKFKTLTAGIEDFVDKNFKSFGMDVMIKDCINQFLSSLDPDSHSDKEILERCKNLYVKVIQCLEDIIDNIDEYSILLQGDCWTNNMMFLYDEQTKSPIDVKLIDWQCQRISSPLKDLNCFFYTLATKKELDNDKFYLNLYYDTLAQRITELGSDPEKVYPRDIFMKHWKNHALYGLSKACCALKVLLFEKDEIPNFMATEETPMKAFSAVSKNQDVFISRLRDTIEYFIKQDLI